MSRWLLRAACMAVFAAGYGMPSARGQAPFELPSPDANPVLSQNYAATPGMRAPATQTASRGMSSAASAAQIPSVAAGVVQQPGYVKLNAPMYPSPRPNIPIWTGATMITNQALAPHEMLYPHTYRAMYPPFYHRVQGKYLWTPFGMRSHEHWKLQGTMVQVKYRSSWPLLGGPHKPLNSQWGPPWK